MTEECSVSYEIVPVTSYDLVRIVSLPGKITRESVGNFDSLKAAEDFQADLMVYDP